MHGRIYTHRALGLHWHSRHLDKYLNANFFEEANKSRQKEAQSIVATIPTIISAYIDATGELPTQWDELSSIAAVMTNDGPATGELTAPIILPNENFKLSVTGPTDSIYTLTATPRIINEAEIRKKLTKTDLQSNPASM